MKFQVVDRVICTVDGGGDVRSVPAKGMLGVIVKIYDESQDLPYGVRFDEPFLKGHDLYRFSQRWCELNHGWWCDEDALELVEDIKIKISAFSLEDMI